MNSNTQGAALAEVLACLKREKNRDLGPICGTIWFDGRQKLFDYIEAALGVKQ